METFDKACGELKTEDIDIAVLASVANVTYVMGIEVPIPFGALPELTFGPWLAVMSVRDRRGVAVVPNFATGLVESHCDDFEPLGFDTLDSFNAIDPRETYFAAVREALRSVGAGNHSRIAVEGRAVPGAVQRIAEEADTTDEVLDAEHALVRARWTKTDQEIQRLRRASHLADIGHRMLADQAKTAGLNEIDMWSAVCASIFMEVGREIVLSGELVTGPRTTTVKYPDGPRDRETSPGDAALMDLSGRVDGYWFDCTNTHVVGEVGPTTEQSHYASASQDACEAAMAALKPGALARDAASAAEHAFTSHGLPMAHYAGHQIGVTVNEHPRLVPYDESVIEPGMVFSVEPGAYQGEGGSFGARSEKMVLVRRDGPEILSTFEWGIQEMQ